MAGRYRSLSDEGEPAQLAYQLKCDAAWRSQWRQVRGWVGSTRVSVEVQRVEDDEWTLNGALVPEVKGFVDLDFSFTPATNLPQLRRLALTQRQTASVSSAWLTLFPLQLSVLPQSYEVGPNGFVLRYPKLWEAEAR